MSTLFSTVWVSADELIEKIKQSGDSDYDLVKEHLETAHAYYLGAMRAECGHNLRLAQQATAALSGKPLQHELHEAIANLLSDLRPPVPEHWRHVSKSASPSTPDGQFLTGNSLAEFFQRAGVSFGIFYPKEYVVAVFPSFEAARSGYRVLLAAGFRMWEVIAVSGDEVDTFLAELRANRTLWDELMAEISRLLDTEIKLVDRYIHWAKTGAGFLVAHSPTEDDAAGISDLLRTFDPIAMHWFMSGYIRHLLTTG